MSPALRSSIDSLYIVFSAYPLSAILDGCPCCVFDTDKDKIHSKPLRKLNGDDLSPYAFKAMSTWGNVNDFKHYLPRILDLLSAEELPLDVFIVTDKLDYAKWREWPQEEQHAIETFLYAWWIELAKANSLYHQRSKS